jgi:hypothetical protein
VMEAVKSDPNILEHLSEELKGDLSFIMDALSGNDNYDIVEHFKVSGDGIKQVIELLKFPKSIEREILLRHILDVVKRKTIDKVHPGNFDKWLEFRCLARGRLRHCVFLSERERRIKRLYHPSNVTLMDKLYND